MAEGDFVASTVAAPTLMVEDGQLGTVHQCAVSGYSRQEQPFSPRAGEPICAGAGPKAPRAGWSLRGFPAAMCGTPSSLRYARP